MRIGKDVEAVPGLALRPEGGSVVHVTLQQRRMSLVAHFLDPLAEGLNGYLIAVVVRVRGERAEVKDIEPSSGFYRFLAGRWPSLRMQRSKLVPRARSKMILHEGMLPFLTKFFLVNLLHFLRLAFLLLAI